MNDILRDELINDSLTRGYAGMSDIVAAALNLPSLHGSKLMLEG